MPMHVVVQPPHCFSCTTVSLASSETMFVTRRFTI
nr:MAG TPA: hypothetical protein [Caudoviricetes sp.]